MFSIYINTTLILNDTIKSGDSVSQITSPNSQITSPQTALSTEYLDKLSEK